MRNEVNVTLKRKAADKLRKGYPLIESAFIERSLTCVEGTIMTLVDERGSIIAKGYYGKQNKGIGWVLTQDRTERIDTTFFKRKLQAAFEKRASLFADEATTAFRLFNGEGDGIGGLTVDFYDGYLVCTLYSEGIYSFRDDIYEAIQAVIDFKGIYEKKRFKANGQYVPDDDFVMGERGEFPLYVKENGITFAVYLNDGPMVGVFLDQREVRARIRDVYAKGKTVLNTFSYTGAFSVAAALGGAKETTSVDLAKRSREKTTEQFEVNGINAEAQEIVVMDVFDYFKYAKRKEKTFDVVILDPPSFARSKKRTFSAAKDYRELVREALLLMRRDGVLVASTNHAAVSMEKFKSFIKEAFSLEGMEYEILEEYRLPADFRTMASFREGNYLKVVFVKRIG